MDPNVYLADGFDISKLTIPNLRSILVEHQVRFPSNAQKRELIEIFNQYIKPKSESILRKYNVGAPDNLSDTGILDMRSTNNLNIQTTETFVSCEDDKTIPSKRHSDSIVNKTKKKVRKNNNNSSFSDSNSDSFLAIEKFEINENDKIFQRGSVDGGSFNILKKTNYADKKAKLDTKHLLSKFDNSLPLSKNFKYDISSFESNSNPNLKSSSSPLGKSKNITPNILSNTELHDNATIRHSASNSSSHDILTKNDVFLHSQDNNSLFNHESSEIILLSDNEDVGKTPTEQLLGPTKNIKDSIIIASSIYEPENDEDVDEDVVLEKEVIAEKLTSQIDIRSLTSFESEGSFSHDSIEDATEMTPVRKLTQESTTEPLEPLEKFNEKSAEVPIKEDIPEAAEQPDAKFINELNNEVIENEDIIVYSSEIKPVIDSKKKHKGKNLILSTFYNVLYTIFIIFNLLIPLTLILSFREIQKNLGYCGFENHLKPLDIWSKVPDFLNDKLLPIQPYVENLETFIVDWAQIECQKCPEHGSCTQHQLTCEPNYIKKTPISSYFGLIPLQEYCEFNSVHEEKMRYLFDYTLSYLRRHNERLITTEELHDYLKSTRPSNIKSEEFEDYWNNFVKNELSNKNENSMFKLNCNTNEITLSHKTPSEYYTKTFGTERNKKSQNLFKKTPPTVNLRNYYTKTDNNS